MTKYITLKLTQKEAMALSMAAGNVMEYDDAIESIFWTGTDRRVARRAWKKLLAVVYGGKS